MADNINISYSFQTESAPAEAPQSREGSAAPDAGPLVAFIDIVPVNLGKGRVLLLHKHSGGQLLVSLRVANALPSCAVFRTLEEHAAGLTASVQELQGKQADARRVLEMIRDAGLLTTATSVCERLRNPAPGSAVELAPSRVFIITCDRPGAVQRLLESMRLAGNLGRHQELCLVDDSRDPLNADLNRQLVEQFNLSSPRDMRYLGAAQQDKLLQGLVAQLPQHEDGIRFLIDRERWREQPSYGLARTLCLLLSVDCRAIVLDDDIVCAAVDSPFKEAGFGFKDLAREAEFYSSEQDMLSRTQKTEFDPLSGHARCLGMNVGQAMETLGVGQLQEDDLRGANAAYLGQWYAHSPILITQCGSFGDPGVPGKDWLLTLKRSDAERLLASEGKLSGAMQSSHFWMGHPRPTFSKIGVISQMTGLDNSQFLPPYFPVYRGEDLLFGAMVEYLYPQGAVLNYDWGVPHLPMDARESSQKVVPPSGKGTVSLPKMITDRTQYDMEVSLEARAEKLALLVREFAETSDRGLLTLYRTEVAESQGIQEGLLEAKLADGVPRGERWQAYLKRYQENMGQALLEVASLEDIPGLPPGYDEQTVLSEFRSYATQFAAALEGWAAIREAARDITEDMLSAGDLAPSG